MMTNEEHERNLRWLFKRVEQARAKGDLRSIVTYIDDSDKPGGEYLLSSLRGRLRLESRRGLFFHEPLKEVREVVWSKRGLWMQLNFEIAERKYGLRFSTPESLETAMSYAPKNWFGELFPIFAINYFRLLAQS